MAGERTYTTRRTAIVNALVEKLKGINQNGDFLQDVFDNVHPRLKFWDEVDTFPAIHLNAGSETREYHTAGYKDRFLNITIRCYVKETDAVNALDELIEDVETVIEQECNLEYTNKQGTKENVHDILVVSIDTDEGVLEPYGVAEILIRVQY